MILMSILILAWYSYQIIEARELKKQEDGTIVLIGDIEQILSIFTDFT
jgi:hypothetical protein